MKLNYILGIAQMQAMFVAVFSSLFLIAMLINILKVYGETEPIAIADMSERVMNEPNTSFVDIGSGLNIVIYQMKCKYLHVFAYGWVSFQSFTDL